MPIVNEPTVPIASAVVASALMVPDVPVWLAVPAMAPAVLVELAARLHCLPSRGMKSRHTVLDVPVLPAPLPCTRRDALVWLAVLPITVLDVSVLVATP